MAKQAKKQPKKPEQLAVSKKILQTVVVVTLLVFLGWLLLANPILNQLDKQRFLEAEEFIQELYESEIRPIAEPTSVESDNSCRYTSTKLGTGTLFCAVRIRALYGNLDAETLDSLLESIRTGVVDYSTNAIDDSSQTSGLIDYDDLDCGVTLNRSTNSESEQNAEILLSCSGEARSEHFVLR